MQTKILEREREDNARFAVSRLFLERFRNYAHLDLELAAGLNIVFGPNAQGKTNLLEAVHLISSGRLLRTTRDAEAIQHGETRATVQATLAFHEAEIRFELERGIRKRVFLNSMSLKRASDVLGRAPSVTISTLDLDLAKGEPSDRRMFFDVELSQTYPSYLLHLTHYKRALEQRNALLKTAQTQGVPSELFEPWEEQLAVHGSAIRAARMAFVGRLSEQLPTIHAWMAPGERFESFYEAKDPHHDETALRAAYAEMRGHETHRGSTQLGPHRDDLDLQVDGQDVRAFGSQGQQRTAVISLKLATMECARRDLGGPPIVLLDDILSDLDERRRRHLVEWVMNHAGQAVLTCTEAEAAGPDLMREARLFRVQNGEIEHA